MLMNIQDKNRKQRNDKEIKKKAIVLRKQSMRHNATLNNEQIQQQKMSVMSK